VRPPRVILAALAAALVLVAGATAATDPAAAQLAKALKANMQKTIGPKVPGIRFTTVTCTLTKDHTKGHCAAHFSRPKDRVVGVYQIAITVNTQTGGVHTRTTSISCKDSKTGAKVICS
jgi:hypothetical protein